MAKVTGVVRLLCVCMMAAVVLSAAASPAAARPPEGKLNYIVKNFCVMCHGAQLQGGSGPPLQPSYLRAKSNRQLLTTLLYGHEPAAMPAWAGSLSRSEAIWLIQKLRVGAVIEP